MPIQTPTEISNRYRAAEIKMCLSMLLAIIILSISEVLSP